MARGLAVLAGGWIRGIPVVPVVVLPSASGVADGITLHSRRSLPTTVLAVGQGCGVRGGARRLKEYSKSLRTQSGQATVHAPPRPSFAWAEG